MADENDRSDAAGRGPLPPSTSVASSPREIEVGPALVVVTDPPRRAAEAPLAADRIHWEKVWLLVLALTIAELVHHVVVRARVPEPSDWRAAAAFVRAELAPTDAISVGPDWADPLMREAMGDAITLDQAGRADLAPFRRLWGFSIRGHLPPDAPRGAPELDRSFGRVRVMRWALPDGRVLDLLDRRIRDAEVSLVRGGREESCAWRDAGAAWGGGIGAGPVYPSQRFTCDSGRPWMWVGRTVIEDMELKPRTCVWQHPSGGDDVTRARFKDVVLGTHIVFYGGLYYEYERDLDGGPIYAVIKVGDRVVGRMTHEDGDGWKRTIADTRDLGERGDVTIEVMAPAPHERAFCWAASVRAGAVPEESE